MYINSRVCHVFKLKFSDGICKHTMYRWNGIGVCAKAHVSRLELLFDSRMFAKQQLSLCGFT